LKHGAVGRGSVRCIRQSNLTPKRAAFRQTTRQAKLSASLDTKWLNLSEMPTGGWHAERRAGGGQVAHSTVDRAAAELNSARLQYPLSGERSLLIHNFCPAPNHASYVRY
jgi:hypothetical protein